MIFFFQSEMKTHVILSNMLSRVLLFYKPKLAFFSPITGDKAPFFVFFEGLNLFLFSQINALFVLDLLSRDQ